MKTFAIALITIFSINVNAVEIPGWERPISESNMNLKKSLGSFEQAQSAKVVVTRKGSSPKATGVQVILNNEQTLSFQILGVEDAGCGSRKLITQYNGFDSGEATKNIEVKTYALEYQYLKLAKVCTYI